MSFTNNSIFWVEVEKIKPNPYQPRKEFDEANLRALADSIRQYGVLQPLVVTRKEIEKPEGGFMTEYELIAGERRLRASKIAGLSQVPVLIRDGEETDQMKLELAIIENLQREDLNAVDRALAFNQLAEKFGYSHVEIAKKIGMSRVYVSNTIRLLQLSQEILDALKTGKISEGHTRPLLMLIDRPAEQQTLFKEILYHKITVRDAEAAARRVAVDRVRKHELLVDADTLALEGELAEKLGTRVQIDKRENGGRITIDFFTPEDLKVLSEFILSGKPLTEFRKPAEQPAPESPEEEKIRVNDVPKEEEKDESDLYSVSSFTL